MYRTVVYFRKNNWWIQIKNTQLNYGILDGTAVYRFKNSMFWRGNIPHHSKHIFLSHYEIYK